MRVVINLKCGHRKVGCLFKQEPSEGARRLLWKRGRDPMARHIYIYIYIYIYISLYPSYYNICFPRVQSLKFC